MILGLSVLPASADKPNSLPQPVQMSRMADIKPASGQIDAPSPESRKQMVGEILSRKEFRNSQLSTLDKALQRVGDKVNRAIGWVAKHMSKLPGLPEKTAETLGVIVIIIFVIIVASIILRLSLSRRYSREEIEENDLYDGPASSKKALDEAGRFAQNGDFRSALRLVYLAVLLDLDDRELIRFDRTGTNWEYYRALKGHSKIQSTLRPVTMTFDRKWYGHEQASDEDYRTFVEAYQAVAASEAGQ